MRVAFRVEAQSSRGCELLSVLHTHHGSYALFVALLLAPEVNAQTLVRESVKRAQNAQEFSYFFHLNLVKRLQTTI